MGEDKIKKQIGFKLIIFVFILVLTLCSCSAATSPDNTTQLINHNSTQLAAYSNITPVNSGVKSSHVNVGDDENSQSDMSITINTSNNHPNYLQNVYLTINVTNNGPDTSAECCVFYKLDKQLTWISDDSNYAYDVSNGIWYIEPIDNGSSRTLNILAEVTNYNTNFNTTATLQSGSTDPNLDNNIAYINFTVPATSDLTVTQQFSSSKVNYLHYFTITINVKNNGPNVANNVTVNCYLNPKIMGFCSSTCKSYNSSSGIWTVGSLQPGSQSVLNIKTKILVFNKSIANVVKSNSSTYDYNQSNNMAKTVLYSNPLTISSLASDLAFETNRRALATKIVNWVRDNIVYSFYYNTKYGASGTLQKLKGNCVDTAHLVVALMRKSGFAAKYKHGTCFFIESKHWYGHVWVDVYVNHKWYSADATGYKNTLGVIKNWNTKTYTPRGTYYTLPF